MMSKENQKLKYCIYARKSTEDDNRQVQSIDDQINYLTKKVEDLGIQIKEIFKESKSAKDPGKRIEFYKMLNKIEAGEIDAIMCWKIDRLSRNPIDGGKIQWLLQKGVIKLIQTSDREYLPEHAGLLFSVETGMTNQYIMDLSKNVKRGQQSKVEKGWFTGVPPIGYLNTITEGKGSNYIKSDPERFQIVRKMWELMLSGQYTPPQIIRIANEELGLRTPKRKKKGGDKLSRCSIYKIFANPFYMGVFMWKGKEYQGKHEPMVTLDEYNKVQLLLGRKGNPRPHAHSFKYTGIAKCGECGASITAETKIRVNSKTGKIRQYIYYHCTRRKKDVVCKQRKVVNEIELKERFFEKLNKVAILPGFRELAQEIFLGYSSEEVIEQKNTYKSLSSLLQDTQKQLDRLLDLRLKDLIAEDIFEKKNKKLEQEIKHLKEKLKNTEDKTEELNDLTRDAIDFIARAKYWFENGDIERIKSILIGLGSNFLLKDGELALELSPWFIPIKNDYPAAEVTYRRFELFKTDDLATNSEKKQAFDNVCFLWRGRRDSNSRPHA